MYIGFTNKVINKFKKLLLLYNFFINNNKFIE